MRTPMSFSIVTVSYFCVLSAGCGGGGAKYVENEQDMVVTTDQINTQDWNRASREMVTSLLSSGVLERAPRRPAVLLVDRVTNDTYDHLDVDLLTKNIRVALNQSGKVVTSTTIGEKGRVESQKAKEGKELEEFMNNTEGKVSDTFDYTLTGKILETPTRAGNVKQNTYTFQLSLTERKTGHAVWEDQRQITKQGKKAGFGF